MGPCFTSQRHWYIGTCVSTRWPRWHTQDTMEKQRAGSRALTIASGFSLWEETNLTALLASSILRSRFTLYPVVLCSVPGKVDQYEQLSMNFFYYLACSRWVWLTGEKVYFPGIFSWEERGITTGTFTSSTKGYSSCQVVLSIQIPLPGVSTCPLSLLLQA